MSVEHLVQLLDCSTLTCSTIECRTSECRIAEQSSKWSSNKKFSSNWPVEHVTAQLFDRPVVRQFSTKCTVDQVYCRTCGIFPIILLEMAQKKARRSINFPSLAIHKVFIFFRFQVASGIIGSPGTGILCTLTVI